MKREMILIIALIFLVGALNSASAFVSSTYQLPPSFQTYYSSENVNQYWPVLADKDTCQGRQDLILQVSPAGCQPVVVRSDLLAEQNVPVFCQIDALVLNPLIDVRQIKNIRFTGSYPKEILTSGYHPAQAAINTNKELTGNILGIQGPLISNIGYVVLVLKKNANESSLPSFVNVTLSAQLEYATGNAFGIGKADFVLSEMTDEQWASAKAEGKQSFWNGKYSVRLEGADENSAKIALYSGDNRVSSVAVNKGKESNPVYLPGSYCQVALIVSYNGFSAEQDRATLEISDGTATERLDVYSGSSFLNGKCSVKGLSPTADGYGSADISCGSERFTLNLAPREVVVPKDVEDVEAVVRVVIENMKKDYTDEEIEEMTEDLTDEQIIEQYGQEVALEDKTYDNAEVEAAYKEAMDAYEKVVDDYPAEAKAKDALVAEITLAENFGKIKTQYELMSAFIDKYPSDDRVNGYKIKLSSITLKDVSNAAYSLNVDNRYRTIRVVDFRKIGEGNVASFVINDNVPINLKKIGEQKIFTADEKKDKIASTKEIVLKDIVSDNEAKVSVYCEVTTDGKTTTSGPTDYPIAKGQSVDICTGDKLKLTSLSFNKVAKITINPQARVQGETNLSVYVGIEKRAIKLGPEKTKEMIKNINESIAKWESISKNLGNVVKGLKGACIATSLVLTFKNLLSGFSGTTLARQQVMKAWKEKCSDKDFSNGKTLSGCYQDHRDDISKDIEGTKSAMSAVNGVIKGIESSSDVVKSKGGLIGEKSINVDTAKEQLAAKIKTAHGDDEIILPEGSEWQVINADGTLGTKTKTVKVSELFSGKGNLESMTYDEMRNIYLQLEMQSGDYRLTDIQTNGLESALGRAASGINDNRIINAEYEKSKAAQKIGEPVPTFVSSGGQKVISDVIPVSGDLKEIKMKGTSSDYATKFFVPAGRSEGTPGQPGQVFEAGYYLAGLTKDNSGNYVINDLYYSKDGSSYSPVESGKASAFSGAYKIGSIVASSSISYNNPIAQSDQKVSYYEIEPYKGMPAIVPFDVQHGWYAATKQTLPAFGGIGAFDSSGRVVSFTICNVGKNGRAEFFTGMGDDICEVINTNTGQPLDAFPGLGETQAKALVQKAISAITEAQQKYGTGKKITIAGQALDVGAPMAAVAETQCEDFMSVTDCQILFNLCDPVICPASRCDLGGTYPVADVVQTGIVGGVLLCLPNFKEGVYVPVCLTGIQAGIDSFVSVLKGHRDCLQKSLDTGQMTGICDELYSMDICGLFWENVGPFLNTLLPKLVSLAYGQGKTRGGGEYLTVQGAWANAQKSMTYFTQTYGGNALKAFSIRSVAEAGTEFCKAYVSAKGPTSLKSVIDPYSPPQFSAYFDEIKFTTATVPATSQYKVFYHIYAGKTAGVSYSVYLKSPPETSYYATNPTVQVASGFIGAGEYASETKDFTAPEGYKELCVRINGEERCGFKKVSTSYAINALSDIYAKQQLTDKDIKSESGCISGTVSAAALLANINIQQAGEETFMPQIYERGIIRICASQNPGSSTEPTRFVEVGYCDDTSIKCWLDTTSVQKAISENNQGAKNATVKELEAMAAAGTAIQKLTLDITEGKAQITGLTETFNKDKSQGGIDFSDAGQVSAYLNSVDNALGKVSDNGQKAQLLFLKAQVLDKVAIIKKKVADDAAAKTATPPLGIEEIRKRIATLESALTKSYPEEDKVQMRTELAKLKEQLKQLEAGAPAAGAIEENVIALLEKDYSPTSSEANKILTKDSKETGLYIIRRIIYFEKNQVAGKIEGDKTIALDEGYKTIYSQFDGATISGKKIVRAVVTSTSGAGIEPTGCCQLPNGECIEDQEKEDCNLGSGIWNKDKLCTSIAACEEEETEGEGGISPAATTSIEDLIKLMEANRKNEVYIVKYLKEKELVKTEEEAKAKIILFNMKKYFSDEEIKNKAGGLSYEDIIKTYGDLYNPLTIPLAYLQTGDKIILKKADGSQASDITGTVTDKVDDNYWHVSIDLTGMEGLWDVWMKIGLDPAVQTNLQLNTNTLEFSVVRKIEYIYVGSTRCVQLVFTFSWPSVQKDDRVYFRWNFGSESDESTSKIGGHAEFVTDFNCEGFWADRCPEKKSCPASGWSSNLASIQNADNLDESDKEYILSVARTTNFDEFRNKLMEFYLDGEKMYNFEGVLIPDRMINIGTIEALDIDRNFKTITKKAT